MIDGGGEGVVGFDQVIPVKVRGIKNAPQLI